VTDYFGKNWNLFVDHRYDTMSCVAKCRSLKLQDGRGWLCRGALIRNPENPMIQAVRALALAGALGMSIGFEALDYGPPTADEKKAYKGAVSIVRAWRLLEVSYTPMPMNVECQTLEHTIDETKAATARVILHKAGRSDILARLGLAPAIKKRIVFMGV
jgi:phage head maturation protease